MKVKKTMTFIMMVIFGIYCCSCDSGKKHKTVATEHNLTYSGKDDLGRSLGLYHESNIPEYNTEKKVGIFYFLHKSGGSVIRDVTEILKNDPTAYRSEEAWIAAGGLPAPSLYFFGKPLFGYYRDSDLWVIEKDIQMLTDAGVDFIALDFSNGVTYDSNLLGLMKLLDKYYRQGWNVPQITFITKADSAKVMDKLYKNFWLTYPEYQYLWFVCEGKPLLIGSTNDTVLKEVFTIKYAQWPREDYHDDGFPWMDFDFDGDGKQTLYGTQSQDTTVMSVSVAQHSGACAFSLSAFYGYTEGEMANRTRSWHNGKNDTAEDAYLYGYNFAEQWEHAISVSPDIVFVTGWNEWTAGSQTEWHFIDDSKMSTEDFPVILVDNCDINNSRDIQPMAGGYGDNYYMQLIRYIRQYKGIGVVNRNLSQSTDESVTIDTDGEFSQWDAVTNTYLDYTDDITWRNSPGYNKIKYTNHTGRNDISVMKAASDNENIYFYVSTTDDMTDRGDSSWMTLFISTGNNPENWYGYDYVLNRVSPEDGTATLEICEGSWSWRTVSKVNIKQQGNQLMAAIPKKDLNIAPSGFRLDFKWADNYQLDENGKGSIWSFYLDGDAAPYGRLNYIYAVG